MTKVLLTATLLLLVVKSDTDADTKNMFRAPAFCFNGIEVSGERPHSPRKSLHLRVQVPSSVPGEEQLQAMQSTQQARGQNAADHVACIFAILSAGCSLGCIISSCTEPTFCPAASKASAL